MKHGEGREYVRAIGKTDKFLQFQKSVQLCKFISQALVANHNRISHNGLREREFIGSRNQVAERSDY